MDTGRSKTENDIACCDLVTGNQFLLLDGTDGKTSDVVFAIRIHPWHFCRLTTNQRTARLDTSFSNTGDDPFDPLQPLLGLIGGLSFVFPVG